MEDGWVEIDPNDEHVKAFKAAVDNTANMIENHGKQFLMNFDIPTGVIAAALRKLANEWQNAADLEYASYEMDDEE